MTDDAPLTIQRADILAPEAQSLIHALNAELSARYPEPGANYFSLDPSEVTPAAAHSCSPSDKARSSGGVGPFVELRTRQVKSSGCMSALKRTARESAAPL
jgi:hypothetical protein